MVEGEGALFVLEGERAELRYEFNQGIVNEALGDE